MWSPHFVPRPKDWPDYVDIVGTIFSDSPVFPPSSLCLPSLCSPTRPPSSSSSSSSSSSAPPTSSSTPRPTTYAPSSELLEFLNYSSSPLLSTTTRSESTPHNNPSNDNDSDSEGDEKQYGTAHLPIFIGFGSMVIENPKVLLQLLLQGMLHSYTRTHSYCNIPRYIKCYKVV